MADMSRSSVVSHTSGNRDKTGEPNFMTTVVETDVDAALNNTVSDEMADILRHISVLQTIITAKPRAKEGVDQSDSLLYLSRYAFGAQIMAKKKPLAIQAMEQSTSAAASGKDVVKTIEGKGTRSGQPKSLVKVKSSGELS